jgi:methyl-accepting chemotaxis protein
MKELLDRADSSDKPYDEVIRSLQEENSDLRRSLIEVQAKLARLVVTIQTLSGTVSKALDDPELGESSLNSKDVIDNPGSPNCRTDELLSREPGNLDFLNMESINDAFQNSMSRAESTQLAVIPSPMCEQNIGANISASFNSLAQQIPSIWSFEYQMGLDPYTAALSSSEESSMTLGKAWTESNSPFSDHIHVLQRLMKSKIEHKMKLPGQNRDL